MLTLGNLKVIFVFFIKCFSQVLTIRMETNNNPETYLKLVHLAFLQNIELGYGYHLKTLEDC